VKNKISTAMVLLFSCAALCSAQLKNNSLEKPQNDIPPCSDETIRMFLSGMPEAKAPTAGDSEGAANVRVLSLGNLVLSCANVAPYDTVVKRLLLKFLRTDKYPLVRADAAADFALLNRAKEYYRDPEIIEALTIAMRHDRSAVVRLEAAHTLVSFCHRDTSEVLDTLVSIATKAPEPSSPEIASPCPRCPSPSSKLRMGAVKGLAAKEFSGDRRVLNALTALSSDSDNFVNKTATNELNHIMGHQKKAEQ
jgi:hypothetical protein